MLSEDKGVTQVATWGVERYNSLIWKVPPEERMPVERYQEYLALLKEIGAIRVSREEEPAEVSFEVWMSGFAGETRHVWVCRLEREPPHTATSLEAFYKTDKPRTPSYVHIDGDWYMGADW